MSKYYNNTNRPLPKKKATKKKSKKKDSYGKQKPKHASTIRG